MLERCIISIQLFCHGYAQSQFQKDAIGTQVTDPKKLVEIIESSIPGYEFPTEGDFAGQGKILLPEEARNLVLPGVAPRRLLTPETSIVREYRSKESLFIDRTKVDVGECSDVYAIVYTRKAFCEDPQVEPLLKSEVESKEYSHVWVVTLGEAGPESNPPVTPNRFMHNMAGGNERWALFRGTDIQKKAEEFVARSEDEAIETPLEESLSWEFCQWVLDNVEHRNTEVSNLQSSVDPNSVRYSVIAKVLEAHKKAAATALSSMNYWKEWAVVA